MVGGGLRSVRSLYQRARSDTAGSSERCRGRRRRGTTQVPPQEVEEEEAQVGQQHDTEEEVPVAQEEEEEAQEDEEAQQTASGSGASASSSVYLRGNNRYIFSLLFYVTCSNAELKLIIFLNHMYRSRQSPQATDTS
jgi:hypothetical protein